MDATAVALDRSGLRELVQDHASRTPDWRFAAVRLAATAVVAGTGTALILTHHPVGAVVGVVLMAIVFSSLMSGQHECLHRSLFARPWLNHGLGLVMGMFMGVPYAGYRRSHLDHHARTHAEGDSEPVLVLTSVWHWFGYLAFAAHGVRLDGGPAVALDPVEPEP